MDGESENRMRFAHPERVAGRLQDVSIRVVMPFDWQQFHAAERPKTNVVDPRRRLRICLAGFVALLLLVFGRTVQLELTQGAGFRAEALRPVERETVLPASRGRILARDGTVLACDRTIAGRGGPLSLAARSAR